MEALLQIHCTWKAKSVIIVLRSYDSVQKYEDSMKLYAENYIREFKWLWALHKIDENRRQVMCILTENRFTQMKEVMLYSLNFGSLVHVILLSNYLIFDSRAVLHSTTFKQHHTMLLQHCFLTRNISSDNFPTAKFQQRTLPVP